MPPSDSSSPEEGAGRFLVFRADLAGDAMAGSSLGAGPLSLRRGVTAEAEAAVAARVLEEIGGVGSGERSRTGLDSVGANEKAGASRSWSSVGGATEGITKEGGTGRGYRKVKK